MRTLTAIIGSGSCSKTLEIYGTPVLLEPVTLGWGCIQSSAVQPCLLLRRRSGSTRGGSRVPPTPRPSELPRGGQGDSARRSQVGLLDQVGQDVAGIQGERRTQGRGNGPPR